MLEQLIKKIPLFQNLNDTTLKLIIGMLEMRSFQEDEVLFNQGEIGETLNIVHSGSIALFSPGSQPIRVVKAGGFFGEIAIIDRKPRSLSARADEYSQVYLLHADDFRNLINKDQQISQSVMANLCERVRYTTDFLNQVRLWVGKISDGDYHANHTAVESNSYQEDLSLFDLAEEFARMAALVQEREDILKNEVALLRIEIDQVKRRNETAEIMDSEYFQSLQAEAKKFREMDD